MVNGAAVPLRADILSAVKATGLRLSSKTRFPPSLPYSPLLSQPVAPCRTQTQTLLSVPSVSPLELSSRASCRAEVKEDSLLEV